MNNNSITIKELQNIELEVLLKCKISEKNLFKIQKEIDLKNKLLKNNLGLRQFPISLNYYKSKYYIKFSGISGTLKLFNIDIEIIPKFINTKTTIWRKSFFNMINIARRKWVHTEKLTHLKYETLNFYDYLALTFIDSLSSIDSTNSIRSYSNEIEETRFLKGKLLLTEQLHKIFSKPGIFICEYDFFNTENEFNFLLNWAVNYLKLKVKNNRIRENLNTIALMLPKVNKSYPIPVTTMLPSQYISYEEAIQIANMLSLGLSVGSNIGSNSGYGYVVNMEKIYEGFIENLLRIIAREDNSWNIVSQKSQVFATGQTEKETDFYTIPDNLLYIDDKLEILIDAKYKNKFSHEVNKRPVNSDLYQMFASLVAHNCQKALLINPKEDTSLDNNLSIWTIKNGNKKMYIASLSLDISNLSTLANIRSVISILKAQLNKYKELE